MFPLKSFRVVTHLATFKLQLRCDPTTCQVRFRYFVQTLYDVIAFMRNEVPHRAPTNNTDHAQSPRECVFAGIANHTN